MADWRLHFEARRLETVSEIALAALYVDIFGVTRSYLYFILHCGAFRDLSLSLFNVTRILYYRQKDNVGKV